MRSRSDANPRAFLAALGASGALGALGVLSLWMTTRKHEREDTTELSSIQSLFVRAASQGNHQIIATVELSGMIPSKEAVCAAVERAKAQDPVLDYAIVKNEDMYLLKHKPGVCGNVSLVQEKDWKVVAHEALNEIQFPDETPIPTWKVILAQSSKSSAALIFILHHAMFDGTSRNRLIGAILEGLAEIDAPTTKAPVVSVCEILKHTRCSNWVHFVARCMRKLQFCTRVSKLPDWYMDLSQAPALVNRENTLRETRQILFQLSREETEAVIRASKKEGTTVHGAVSAATLLALKPLGISDANCQVMGCFHLISLWRQLAEHIPEASLSGCYVSMYTTNTVVDCTDAWKVARDVKSELLNFVPPSKSQFVLQLTYNKLLKIIFRKPNLPGEYIQLGRNPTLSISNNGKVDLLENCKGTNVEGCYATSAIHNSPGNFGTLNIQTVSGRLCVSFSYYSHIWTDEVGNAYVRRFREMLTNMSSPD